MNNDADGVSDEPQAGYYKCRLVKGGPYVPVRLAVHGERDESGTLTEDEQMRCWVGGGQVQLSQAPWPYCGRFPISEQEYDWMLDDARDAKTNPRGDRAGDPMANPLRPVDWAGVWR